MFGEYHVPDSLLMLVTTADSYELYRLQVFRDDNWAFTSTKKVIVFSSLDDMKLINATLIAKMKIVDFKLTPAVVMETFANPFALSLKNNDTQGIIGYGTKSFVFLNITTANQTMKLVNYTGFADNPVGKFVFRPN